MIESSEKSVGDQSQDWPKFGRPPSQEAPTDTLVGSTNLPEPEGRTYSGPLVDLIRALMNALSRLKDNIVTSKTK